MLAFKKHGETLRSILKAAKKTLVDIEEVVVLKFDVLFVVMREEIQNLIIGCNIIKYLVSQTELPNETPETFFYCNVSSPATHIFNQINFFL